MLGRRAHRHSEELRPREPADGAGRAGPARARGDGARRAARSGRRRGGARARGGAGGAARADARRPRPAGAGGRGAAGAACSAACCRRAGRPAGTVGARQDLGAASSRQVPIETRGRRSGWIEAHSREAARVHAPRRTTSSRRSRRVLGAAGERARHDDLVSDSEARFRELADTTPALMWMTDAEGDVTFVNEGWLRFTGGHARTSGVTFARAPTRTTARRRCGAGRRPRARREEFRCEYRLRHAPVGRLPLGARGGRAALRGRRVRGLRGHRHGHPRAPRDGGGAARVRGELPRPRRHRSRDDVDDRRGRARDVRERGLDALHGHAPRGRARRELAARRAPGRRGGDARDVGRRRARSAAPGSASTACSTTRASTAGSSTAACRATRAGATPATWAPRSTSTSARRWRARLLEVYQREHKIAETLQRSLLPERLPQIEGLQLAARYLPGARGAAIGGDWYDVLERPDGRVALVVGDVVGHGLRAAATMGQLRNAFRAYGLVESSPGRGGGAHQPAGDERGGGRDGHRRSTSCSTARPARCPSARRATRRRSCSRPTARTSSRAGARCRSEPRTPRCSARRAPCSRPAPRCCSTRTASWSAAT